MKKAILSLLVGVVVLSTGFEVQACNGKRVVCYSTRPQPAIVVVPAPEPTVVFVEKPAPQPIEFVNHRTIVEDETVRVYAGATITLSNSYGVEQGTVTLEFNGVTQPVTLVAWESSGVTVQLPEMTLAGARDATIHVFRSSGNHADTIPVLLTNKPKISSVVIR